MGIKPITIGEKYRNIIPEPEKANPLPIQPKKKTNVSSSKSAPVKKEEAPPSPLVKNADGSMSCDLRYKSHVIIDGKYNLEGLPAVYASEEEAQTLEILMEDPVTGVKVAP
jgi:hypothetical protein